MTNDDFTDLEDFDFELSEDDTLIEQPDRIGPSAAYIERKIQNMAHDPPGSMHRIADALNMPGLSYDGSLTEDQSDAVRFFVGEFEAGRHNLN